MNIPYELIIGFRYLRAKRKQTVISIVTSISIAGVTLGVMALIIVLAVMTGFEMDLRDKILGTNSHIIVQEYNGQGIQDYQLLIDNINTVQGVVSSSPFIYGQIMLTSGRSSSGLVLRGIDFQHERAVTDLSKNIIEGDLQLLNVADTLPGIAVGKELARSLGIFVDDVITAITPLERITPMGITPKFLRFKVVAIFNSGMYEYDMNLAYISLKAAQRLFNMKKSVTGIEVKIADIFEAKTISKQIQQTLGFPYWTRDWMQMNKNLFSALKLEKLAMFIILVLIILVASFNIISTLVMMVMEKNKDIGILKSMGATSKSILAIFIFEGLVIGVVGTFLGCVGGLAVCWAADTFHLIKLAGDIYYISYLPFKTQFLDIFIICFSSLFITLLATTYPAWQASRLDPVICLRYE